MGLLGRADEQNTDSESRKPFCHLVVVTPLVIMAWSVSLEGGASPGPSPNDPLPTYRKHLAMPFEDIELSIEPADCPPEVTAFLREAELRVHEFVERTPLQTTGFVASNYAAVYPALRALHEAQLATSNTFCEWGSGFGVIASLASMLDFNASGIEIDRDLVDAARKLAADFDLSTEFVHGSFIPRGGEQIADEACIEYNNDFFWLSTDSDNAYDELEIDPDEIDVVFAYPWPGEEVVLDDLFEAFAGEGALLLTFHEYDAVQLRRKVS